MPTLPQPIHDLLTALWHNPACFFIIVALNLLGVMMQKYPVWPDKWNRFIPWTLFALGSVLVPLLVSPAIFPQTQQHATSLLAIIGFIFGVVAFLVHTTLVQWGMNFVASKLPGEASKPPQ